MGIAFFDMDGTITKKDTFIDFIVFVCGRNVFFKGLFLLSPYIVLHLIGLYPNDRLKEKFFQIFLAGHDMQTLRRLGQGYALSRLPSLVYIQALDRIEWHKSQGHRIVILTASSSIWLEAWCTLHGLELIGTDFEVDMGRYTGKIAGKNCHGREKVKFVDQILLELPEAMTYGYGNSRSDWHFLNRLAHRFYKPFRR